MSIHVPQRTSAMAFDSAQGFRLLVPGKSNRNREFSHPARSKTLRELHGSRESRASSMGCNFSLKDGTKDPFAPSSSQNPSRSSSSSTSFRTPSRGTDSNLSDTTSDFDDIRDTSCIPSGERAMKADVDELARLELGRFACDHPHLALSHLKGGDATLSDCLPRRERQSSKIGGKSARDNRLSAGSRSNRSENDSWSEDDGSSAYSTPGSLPLNYSATSMASLGLPLIEDQEQVFPCPFSLYHATNTPCADGAFKNPRCVEEHLLLCHCQPPFCPVCGGIFSTHAQCDSHIVSRSCEITKTMPTVEGLTTSQMKELTHCVNPRLSKVAQYQLMWKVVHPGIDMLGKRNELDCALAEQELRDYWEKHGWKAVREFFARKGFGMHIEEASLEAVESSVLSLMMERLRLDRTSSTCD